MHRALSTHNRDDNPTLAEYLYGALYAGGEAFDSIENMTHTLLAWATLADDAVEMAPIENWLHQGGLVHFDDDFGNGNGHVVFPFDGIH
ncbi:hypothetical protein EYZ11_004527 [Aspergillus tanneri]|uniref:Uncharacterized protein n=1 Tax=Aspergillus tanneri TaxID=1220188 RepID=A0A4S3JKW0_9EURO|nr:uncharacterized protein ATNIH1004_008418 [Aspergillus tanneri]KAA8644219.1 hypothetical protein ATNIH1004_008418 [Aspergillus tanneri]THC95980.1 hypothetical protein EYZ11_004527 [Aspergillus tanneri]